VVERAIRHEVESGFLTYVPPPITAVKRWEPKDFALETTTVWDFPSRGDWAVHSGDYRGNWPPQVPRNLILRYTVEGDLIVDAFAGGGTTLIEAWLLRRHSIGLDLSNLALQTINARLKEMEDHGTRSAASHVDPAFRPKVIKGNALRLTAILNSQGVKPGTVKLVCAHPPYLDSLSYTGGQRGDLALIDDSELFRRRMRQFAREARAVLSPGGICGVLIGDVRKHGKTVPLGFKTFGSFLSAGFQLESVVIKTQHRDRSSEFYFGHDAVGLLMAHEYLLILRNNGG
jgi:hypothetical protein